jgi:hypothetical protein
MSNLLIFKQRKVSFLWHPSNKQTRIGWRLRAKAGQVIPLGKAKPVTARARLWSLPFVIESTVCHEIQGMTRTIIIPAGVHLEVYQINTTGTWLANYFSNEERHTILIAPQFQRDWKRVS